MSNWILNRGTNHWNNNKRKFKIIIPKCAIYRTRYQTGQWISPLSPCDSLTIVDCCWWWSTVSRRELLKRNWRHSQYCLKPSAKKRRRSFGSLYGDKWEELIGRYWTNFYLVPFFFDFILWSMFEMKIKTIWNLSNTKKTGSKWNFLIPSIITV